MLVRTSPTGCQRICFMVGVFKVEAISVVIEAASSIVHVIFHDFIYNYKIVGAVGPLLC